MEQKKEKKYRDYLDKTFIEELNYKIWVTKGSRFNANKRLLQIAKHSNLSNTMLSIYLIAFGLISVYNIYDESLIEKGVLPYLLTCLSIFLLAFGLIENAKNYQLRAAEFHNCGIQLSKLYNNLRVFKTMNTSANDHVKEEFARTLSAEYEVILEKFENHEPIDYEVLKVSHPDYFELKMIDTFYIKLCYYFKTLFMYQLIIVIPPICFFVLFL